jgi:hypothetical protein
MENRELSMLLKLREHVIKIHQKTLKDSGGMSTSIVSSKDVVDILSTVVNSVDDILKPHVNFSSNK